MRWYVVGAVVAALAVVAAACGIVLVVPHDLGIAWGGAVAGLAAVVLAALTSILLGINQKAIEETRRATEATERAAEATKEAAEATRQQAAAASESTAVFHEQMAREWSPILVLADPPPDLAEHPNTPNLPVKVRNLGRGPAINVVICVRNESQIGSWWRSPLFHVAADKDCEASLTRRPEEYHPALFEGLRGQQKYVAMCEDQAGNLYRFDSNQPRPSVLVRPTSDYSGKEWAHGYEQLLKR